MAVIDRICLLYFSIRRSGTCACLVDHTWTNYVHSILVCGCMWCCLQNNLLAGSFLFLIVAVSMILKNLLLAILCKAYYVQNYTYETRGNKYSFQHPRMIYMVKKEGDKVEQKP